MEGFWQHGDSDIANIPFVYQWSPSTKQPSWNSSTNILRPIYPLEQKLMEGFVQHGDLEVAKITQFAHQRLPSTKQPSWNSSNIILFETIYPLKQKLDGRQQADRLHRKAEIIRLRCQRGSSIEQPSWNLSNIIFQTICPLEQKLDGRRHNGLNSSFQKSKKGMHYLIILKFFKQHILWLYVPYSADGSLRFWQFQVIPTSFFCWDSLGQWNRWAV